MADDKKASDVDKSKPIKIGVVVIVMGIVAWQVMGLMSDGSSSGSVSSSGQQTVRKIPNPNIPKPAAFAKKKEPAELTPREQQLMALQQQTEAKYIAAMNELQMLRIEKEIAETNKEISAAKLDTIAAQKGIEEMLAPPKPKISPTQSVQSLANPQQAQLPSQQSAQSSQPQAPVAAPAPILNYTVVSVSRLRGKWQAVLGSDEGRLYHVSVGDVLGSAGTVVMAIDQSGVLLETNGKQQKISMVPII